MSEERGSVELVRSFGSSQFPSDWGALVAGTTTPHGLLAELSQEPGWERVDFRGQLAPLEARDLLRQGRVGLVTFQRNAAQLESLPTKMFEYFAEGLPVIASDFPLWRGIIEEHDCGLLVDETDPDSIAAAVRRYAEDPDLLARHGRNARAAAEGALNWEHEEERLVRAYDELTSVQAP
jgi:glycosyltransferase involved in cell wall biosynthesis